MLNTGEFLRFNRKVIISNGDGHEELLHPLRLYLRSDQPVKNRRHHCHSPDQREQNRNDGSQSKVTEDRKC